MSFFSFYDILEQVEHRNPIYRKGGRMEREYPTQLYLDDIFDPDWSVECIIDIYKNDRKFAAQAPCFSYGVSGAVVGFH